MQTFHIELIIAVDVQAENRAEAEIKAIEIINDNSIDYITAEAITPAE